MVVAEAAAVRGWLNAKLRDRIWPQLAAQFGVAEEELWLQDAFVVRYEAEGQRGLGTHADDSELSFNLLLSDPADFGGGGTHFEAANTTLAPRQGQMIAHFGRLRHEGVPVEWGRRYILAGFVRVQPLAAAWKLLRPAEEAPAAEAEEREEEAAVEAGDEAARTADPPSPRPEAA